MDDQRFDPLVRSLAAGSSRHQVSRGLLAGGGVLAARGVASTVAASKVTICHWNGTSYNQISVSTNAIPAYSKHPGDVIAPDFTSDSINCGGCGIACVVIRPTAVRITSTI